MGRMTKLAQIMMQRGLSDRKLAIRFNNEVSDSTIRRWRLGKTCPKSGQAKRLADTLEVPLSEIIDEVDTSVYPSALSEDERFVIQVIRDMKLERDEAVRLLAGRKKN
jgi:ribosome-binding protein aMBF1 (putative translation factor)